MFILSYWVKLIYPIAWLFTLLLIGLFLFDILLLYGLGKGVDGQRKLPIKLSNSDVNPIQIVFETNYPFKTFISIIDELPKQFQKRDFKHKIVVIKGVKNQFDYSVRPVDRGEYVFGNLILFASSPLRMIMRKFVFQKDQMVPVYPSIIQMQQYDFLAISNRLSMLGLKKIRRIGHTQEFE